MKLAFLGMITLGWTAFRPVSWFNLSDGFFLAAILVIAAKMLQGDRSGLAPHAIRRSPSLTLQAAIVLLGGAAVTSFFSWNPETSILQVVRIAYLTLIWFWALRTVCPGYSAFMHLIKGWKWMVLLTALSGFYGSVAGGDRYLHNENRLIGFTEHPNALGITMAIGLPVVLLVPYPRTASRRVSRDELARIGVPAVAVAAMLQSGSVTSAMAAIAGVAVAYGCRVLTTGRRNVRGAAGRIRLTPIALGFMAVVGLAFLLGTSNPVAERMEELGQEGSVANEGSVDVRADLNNYAISHLDDRILYGVGLDSESGRRDLPSHIDDRHPIHNFYLKMLHEAGLPALVALLVINIVAAHQGLVLATRLRDPVLRSTAVAMLGSLAAANVGAQFQPIGLVRYYWLPVALIACLWALARARGLALGPDTPAPDAAGRSPVPVS